MTAEGNETSGGEAGRGQPGGFGAEGPGRRSEGDLFSERRARRAAESGEVALARRAEAAEATVQTLERHVASLQQRLHEAEEERLRMSELLDAERTAALEREQELRLVKQREYAEQQLRVEAEERLAGLGREGRAESERLALRVSASEAEADELSARLEELQRRLAEAEQAAAAGREEVRRAEHALQLRLDELERRAAQMQRGLEAERAARERTEIQLEAMSRGHRQMQILVGDVKAIVERLTGAVTAVEERSDAAARAVASPPRDARAALPGALADIGAQTPEQGRGVEMADALAAAVERLRARAEVAVPEARGAASKPSVPPMHKHSLSLIGRWRFRRKQRRSR